MTDAPRGAAARHVAPHVLAAVVRRYGHFDTAEDAVQEALLAAAAQWPKEGLPEEPPCMADHGGIAAADGSVAQRGRPGRAGRNVVARWTLAQDRLAPGADTPAGDRRRHPCFAFHVLSSRRCRSASQIALTLRAVGGLRDSRGGESVCAPESDDDTTHHSRQEEQIKGKWASLRLALRIDGGADRLGRRSYMCFI